MDSINYEQGRTELDEIFDEFDYGRLLEEGKTHNVSVDVHECGSGAIIWLSFPGYKAKGRDKPDYRVDIHKDGKETSLSHANLLVDIFNKCHSERIAPTDMWKFLQTAAEKGRQALDQIPRRLKEYQPVEPPSSELIDEVAKVHDQKNKTFNRGGSAWDLDFEELTYSMFWIVLQEDINYPMPDKQGRRMPLSRYTEAVWCAQEDPSAFPTVIDRALVEGRLPGPWPQVDYGIIPDLG